MGAWREGVERRVARARQGAAHFICLAVPGHLVLPEALLFPEEETEPLKGQSARGLVMEMGLDQSC